MLCLKETYLYFLASFIFGIKCLKENDAVYTHCYQMDRNNLESTPKTIIPTETSEIFEPIVDSGKLHLELCPDGRFLKISWIANQTSDGDVNLCYKIESVLGGDLQNMTCFRMHLFKSRHTSVFDCWFPMLYLEHKPTVTAWIRPVTIATQGSFYGTLETKDLDPNNTCRDMCEVMSVDIDSQINCQTRASIIFDTSTTVKHLSFDAVDMNSCQENPLNIHRQKEGHIEYQLNCSLNGFGHIKVLYITHGKYCLKYQTVSVVCPNNSNIPVAMTAGPDGTHSFGTFVLFGLVCFIVISAGFFGVILGGQWIINKRHRQMKFHRDSVTDSRNHSISVEDNIHSPLKMDTYQHKETIKPCSPEKTKSEDLVRKQSKRTYSASSMKKTTPECLQEKRAKPLSKLRRSVTIALLEDTDPFYKKRLLFLPIPFDHFTNEVTKILKNMFTGEAGLLSQCCYDRNVYKHFMTSDRRKWIDTMLGDHDKVLVLLCFKSLNSERIEGKNQSMVDEILERLQLSNMESRRLCKVVFLYLTDSSEHVRRKHYGDVFHVCDSDSFSNFVCDVMSFCGRCAGDHNDLIEKVLRSNSSKHFLRYIGIKKKAPNMML